LDRLAFRFSYQASAEVNEEEEVWVELLTAARGLKTPLTHKRVHSVMYVPQLSYVTTFSQTYLKRFIIIYKTQDFKNVPAASEPSPTIARKFQKKIIILIT